MVRHFRAGDAAALAAYRSDPQVARFQTWSTPVSLQQASAAIEQAVAHDPQMPGWCQYALEHREDQTLVGDIGVNLHTNRMQAVIGFTIATEYQGCGYASEALRRMLQYLFVDRGLQRVSAECDARNLPCIRLLDRLRFRREGYRVANTWLKGEWTDDVLFGMLAADWRRTSP